MPVGYDEMSDISEEAHLSSDDEALSSNGEEQMSKMNPDQYQGMPRNRTGKRSGDSSKVMITT